MAEDHQNDDQHAADMLSRAQVAMDGKAKPPGSLGQLEDIAIKLSVLQDTLKPAIDDATLLIFAADHGFTKSTPGVSAYPRQVSVAVFKGIANGDAASSVLCKANNMKLRLVDVGLDAESENSNSNERVVNEKNNHITVETNFKVERGSDDFLLGPALSEDAMMSKFKLGCDTVDDILQHSTSQKNIAIGIGELGIGNTTSAAALICAITGHPPELICGRGTGVDDAGLALKVSTVKAALEKNKELINTRDPWKILQAVGGLEIAAMVGAMTRAYHHKIAVIVDGFISGSAALVACSMDANVGKCLFWSHKSAEQGAALLLEAVKKATAVTATASDDDGHITSDVVPILAMGLKLGEGTGAVLALPILRSAAAIMSNMAALNDIL